jgi:hypothetical protein
MSESDCPNWAAGRALADGAQSSGDAEAKGRAPGTQLITSENLRGVAEGKFCGNG